MIDRDRSARELWTLLEPVHAVGYFAPEPLAALKEAGYRGFWMGYFAGRAAPLGAVGPDVVHALFYNFAFERVARALPSAWTFAPPEAALAARERGSVAALRRALGDSVPIEDVARAADLASRAAASAPMEGRPIFAANRSLPEPEEPVARLWHAATLLREHRGDGHVAALTVAGVGGRESHVVHALASGSTRDVYAVARDLGEAEWAELHETLRARGLADGNALSERGARLKAEVEERTDRLAATAYESLSANEIDELARLLRPLARAVVDTGDIPLNSPMGLNLRDSLKT